MEENKFINKLIVTGMLTFWTVFAPTFSCFVIYLGITLIKMHREIFCGSILLLTGVIYGTIYILYLIQFIIVSWQGHKEKKANKEKEEENK